MVLWCCDDGASLSCFYTDIFFFIALYYLDYYSDNSAGLELERHKNSFRVTFNTRMPLDNRIRTEFINLLSIVRSTPVFSAKTRIENSCCVFILFQGNVLPGLENN